MMYKGLSKRLYWRKARQSESFEQLKVQRTLNVMYAHRQYSVYQGMSCNQESARVPHNQPVNVTDQIQKFIWTVISHTKDRLVHVKQGEVLRFGRITFIVAEVCTSPSQTDLMADLKQSEASHIVHNLSLNQIEQQDDLSQVTHNDVTAQQTLTPKAPQNGRPVFDNHKKRKLIVTAAASESTKITNDQMMSIGGILPPHGGHQRNKSKQVMKTIDENRACRICLEEDATIHNPLVTPCNCKGGLKYIHLECVKTWLDSKKFVFEDQGVSSYFWDELQCEICKAFFLLRMWVEGKLIDLLSIDRPLSGQYMVLESEMPSSQIKQKAIHVLDFSKQSQFVIGRSETSDVKIADMSVSRDQAQFTIDKDRIVLQDLGSKFGSFVRIDGPLQVDPARHYNRQTALPLMVYDNLILMWNEQRFNCLQKVLCATCLKEQNYDFYKDWQNLFPNELIENLNQPHAQHLQSEPSQKLNDIEFKKVFKRSGLDLGQVNQQIRQTSLMTIDDQHQTVQPPPQQDVIESPQPLPTQTYMQTRPDNDQTQDQMFEQPSHLSLPPQVPPTQMQTIESQNRMVRPNHQHSQSLVTEEELQEIEQIEMPQSRNVIKQQQTAAVKTLGEAQAALANEITIADHSSTVQEEFFYQQQQQRSIASQQSSVRSEPVAQNNLLISNE